MDNAQVFAVGVSVGFCGHQLWTYIRRRRKKRKPCDAIDLLGGIDLSKPIPPDLQRTKPIDMGDKRIAWLNEETD
jgi:hypothetical protein